MTTWGGKRENAGRKKQSTKEKRVRIHIFVLPETEVFLKKEAILKGSMGKVIDEYRNRN